MSFFLIAHFFISAEKKSAICIGDEFKKSLLEVIVEFLAAAETKRDREFGPDD